MHDISHTVRYQVVILELEGKNIEILRIYPVTLEVNQVEALPCGHQSSGGCKGNVNDCVGGNLLNYE